MSTLRLRYFVAAALLSHGLALWLAARLEPLAPSAAPAETQPFETTLAVEIESDPELEPPPERAAFEGDDVHAEPTPAPETAARTSVATTDGAAQLSDSIATPSLSVASSGDTSSTASVDHPSPNSSNSDRSPKALTLDQLGIGKPSLFALGDAVKVAPPTAEDRLARSMAQATLDADIDKGLGPATLVTTTLKQIAMGQAPPRSKARLRVFANGAGTITRIEVEGTNLGFDAWRAVANKTLAALTGKRLRHGLGRPLSLLVEIESKVQLPSGRSPGTSTKVLGVPVQESGHEDSAKVEILSPKVGIEMVEILDPTQSGGATVALPVPVVKFTILGIDGDLVDIGAKGRQVIHTRVLEQTVL